jgi:hypothetical protein
VARGRVRAHMVVTGTIICSLTPTSSRVIFVSAMDYKGIAR